jgi:hypothetical protein
MNILRMFGHRPKDSSNQLETSTLQDLPKPIPRANSGCCGSCGGQKKQETK